MHKERILVIGASGQIGTVLVERLREVFGTGAVIASDLRAPSYEQDNFQQLDVTDASELANVIRKQKITHIYHLAAILSANAERNPLSAWDLNMKALLNVFDVSREFKITKVFVPSSIAVFGGDALKIHTPQHSHLDPATVYGISKVAAENWALYYHSRYGLDVRSLRYPGVISYQSLPGGGTTDYAVDFFKKSVKGPDY
jgi:threonine 3-dehydrogenase